MNTSNVRQVVQKSVVSSLDLDLVKIHLYSDVYANVVVFFIWLNRQSIKFKNGAILKQSKVIEIDVLILQKETCS